METVDKELGDFDIIEEANTYRFKATGGFDINQRLEPEISAMGNVTGFKLPDGRTARIIIALEIEAADGSKCEYITADRKMAAVGFESLDYDELHFEEIE